MSLPALDRYSVIPLYYQIQQFLLEQIRSGAFKAGQPLPSEQEIAAALGVSRMTARQALKSLCDMGLTYTERGKGTFVSAHKLEKSIRQVLSFTEEMSARGLRANSTVLAFETVPATAETAQALSVPENETLVRLERIRFAGPLPMGIECSHLPLRLCPDLLTSFEPSGSLYKVLNQRYGIQMSVADEVVEAALAGVQEGRMLGIAEGSPVFLFTRTSLVQSGQPVEYVKSTYRADRYKIRNRLTRLSRELLS
jgi:GntR family transcriptional regulator